MKTTVLALACTLALGTGAALAGSADDGTTKHKSGAASAVDKTKSGAASAVDKTTSAIRGAGEKLGHKLGVDKDQQSAADDPSRDTMHGTRAMGGPGRHPMDRTADAKTTREQRMDDAYANWKSKQVKQ
jgi:hypothetical protein